MGGGLENMSCVVAGLQGRALLWDRKQMQVVGKGPGGVSTVETGDVSPKWVVRHRHLWLRLATSPGQHRVLASILMGILTGNVTRGSGSPTAPGP